MLIGGEKYKKKKKKKSMNSVVLFCILSNKAIVNGKEHKEPFRPCSYSTM
jgi:hypothetical protein